MLVHVRASAGGCGARGRSSAIVRVRARQELASLSFGVKGAGRGDRANAARAEVVCCGVSYHWGSREPVGRVGAGYWLLLNVTRATIIRTASTVTQIGITMMYTRIG